MLLKVVAYITREAGNGIELLVFRHPSNPENPIQVPQGTIEAGESILDGLWREVHEETGLFSLTLVGRIARVPYYADWLNQWQERHVFHLIAPSNTLDAWTHTVSAGESDQGLEFAFFWMPVAMAGERLHRSQNHWLNILIVTNDASACKERL